ncbi:MAG: ABC transporter substrate-binding protein [Nitrososphaerales archaeon]
MRRSRTGISTTVAAVVVVVVFIVAGVGGYFIEGGGSGGSSSTTSSSAVTLNSVASSSFTTSSTPSTASSTSSTSSSSSGPNQTAVMASLASAAQAECAGAGQTCLTIYTTQDAGNWAEYYGPLFDQQYPWAAGKVDYVSLSASDETTTVLSDYQAHNPFADLVTGTLAPLIPDYQGGAFLNYTSPEVQFMNYSADAVGPAWVDTDLAIVFMIYNPTLLPANEVPTSWAALANPIYKGGIVFQSAASLSITTAEFYYLYQTMGNSSGQWTSLMKGIAANHPLLPSTAGQAESSVLNGQAKIGIDTLDSYVTAIKGDPNAPLKIVDLEPMVYTPGVVAITSNAPHPAMAKLVEAWLISRQGQLATYETNHLPYQTAIGAPLFQYLPADYKLVDAYSTYANTTLFQNPGSWSDTFENIFGG